MKLYNIALIGLLLGSSAACAGVEKETTSTQKADTAKFIGYSAFALANGAISLDHLYSNWDTIISGSIKDKILYLYPVVAPAFLAKSDAKAAWHYFQKVFHLKNKIEESSSLTSEHTKTSSAKKISTANLLGYAGLGTINIGAGLFLSVIGSFVVQDKPLSMGSLAVLLNMQAFSRLALSNFQSMKEHYRKAFPSDDINKGTSHETA